MTETNKVSNESKKGADVFRDKVIAALLLLIPMVVFAVTPIYNFSSPGLSLLGLTFFYWFPILWLAITAVMYFFAAMLINRMEGEH
ncbi:MAG: hypothetical protein M1138_07085 [Candidatus Thermoplasmatota archaeon]|jgi:hypothetical protein|nr:hypothetical protein [Candidatus Thermoplasmatota archaeon]